MPFEQHKRVSAEKLLQTQHHDVEHQLSNDIAKIASFHTRRQLSVKSVPNLSFRLVVIIVQIGDSHSYNLGVQLTF